MDLSFDIGKRLPEGPGKHGRSGVIHTPHGDIQTPAFIPVATKATVKTLTPEQIRSTGAQAILSNAYHLYLQPGHDTADEAGGVAEFENWHGPTYTDSGGFQVMSLGVGFKKVLAMDIAELSDKDIRAAKKERMAQVDEDGVDFKSVIDGSKHRFTPEKSMQIQHGLGADIMFAFDELTTLVDTRTYQEESVARTHRWAKRCLDEHDRLTRERAHRPKQSLWGVVQGAQYEDLRRQATRGLLDLDRTARAVHGERALDQVQGDDGRIGRARRRVEDIAKAGLQRPRRGGGRGHHDLGLRRIHVVLHDLPQADGLRHGGGDRLRRLPRAHDPHPCAHGGAGREGLVAAGMAGPAAPRRRRRGGGPGAGTGAGGGRRRRVRPTGDGQLGR